MKSYELDYLINPDLSEEELRAIQEKIALAIQEGGGLLGEINPPVKKNLSFPVKKKILAFLATLNFQLGSAKLINLEKIIKEDSQILRHLITIKPLLKMNVRPSLKKIVKEKKAELKEIEEKLEEILGK